VSHALFVTTTRGHPLSVSAETGAAADAAPVLSAAGGSVCATAETRPAIAAASTIVAVSSRDGILDVHMSALIRHRH
jgi:hypothetical protein